MAFRAYGTKMIVGPWTHAMSDPILTVEQVRWLDYTLRGIENGISEEPPLYYYTINAPADNAWRYAWNWPLPNQNLKNFYLAEGLSGTVASVNDGGLSAAAPSQADARDDYTVDYGITVFDGLYRRDRRSFAGDMTPSPDEKGLTYTSAPLTADMEITGHPVVDLWVTSNAPDGYFLVYLEEVDASGFSHYVSDGVMRGSSREILHDTPQAAQWQAVGIPYHRSFAEDYAPLSEQPAKLSFECFPTSYVFRAGNRIRVTITCAEQKTYQYPDDMVFDPAPVISIYRDANHPSSITLPVAAPIKAAIRIKPETLNLKSKGLFTVFITPPEDYPKGYRAEDIDVSTVTCGGAPAVWGKVAKDTLIAKFKRKDLTDIPCGPKATLTVKGKFNYGIPFEGNDRIRVLK